MTAGRTCPTGYRYGAASLARLTPRESGALYVVGGLYGNLPALGTVLAMFARDPAEDKRLVFNGDFHWFDTSRAVFEAVDEAVSRHDALRGNVETELAQGDPGAGCGCGYPEWVDQGTVDRSNAIITRLITTAAALPERRSGLAALPMTLRYQVGAARVAVVHGDAESLAGWGFAQEHLRDSGHLRTVARWFEHAGVDVFACSHTCLPVLQAVGPRTWIANNGAAGMPNFRGERFGLLTRIATAPFEGPERIHGIVVRGVHIDALAVPYDAEMFAAQFLSAWPPGSPAHASYWGRLAHGPAYARAQALRIWAPNRAQAATAASSWIPERALAAWGEP